MIPCSHAFSCRLSWCLNCANLNLVRKDLIKIFISSSQPDALQFDAIIGIQIWRTYLKEFLYSLKRLEDAFRVTLSSFVHFLHKHTLKTARIASRAADSLCNFLSRHFFGGLFDLARFRKAFLRYYRCLSALEVLKNSGWLTWPCWRTFAARAPITSLSLNNQVRSIKSVRLAD